MTNINWNHNLKLILADVDETIADVYTDAVPAMLEKIESILAEDITLFLVTGAGLESVTERIISKISLLNRHKIIVAHCSGAEICGFDHAGNLKAPYYSVYDQKMNPDQKLLWRKVIDQIIQEFRLKTTPTMSVAKFHSLIGDDPFTVMKADRGPQITLEFVNSYDLTSTQLAHVEASLDINIPQYDGKFDLRTVIYNRAEELLVAANLPVHPHLAGVFALDFILEGVSKTSALENVLQSTDFLDIYNLPHDILSRPELIEIWGDKFAVNGGSDRKMCLAVNHKVRAIDFRNEPQSTLGTDYNIVLWDGSKQLHDGLLEYLELRG